MNIPCYICKKILKAEGGLLFSPPVGQFGDESCMKTHLCKKCYMDLWQWIDEQNKLFKDIIE
jgi:hypothetical protein